MEKPRLFVDDKIEMCDGHSDYGYSILYCEVGGKTTEIFRTRYETNRFNEQTDGILSVNMERGENQWVATLKLVAGGRETLTSKDGKRWR
jgi:hypothetical protein